MSKDLKQLAAIDPNSFGGLTAFYREKIRLLEDEKIEWISSFEILKTEQKVKHETEWELFRLKSKLQTMEIDMSEINLKFLEQKNHIFGLQNEKENLMEQLSNEKVKVEQLLMFIQPGDRNFLMKENPKNSKTELKFTKNELNIEQAKLKGKNAKCEIKPNSANRDFLNRGQKQSEAQHLKMGNEDKKEQDYGFVNINRAHFFEGENDLFKTRIAVLENTIKTQEVSLKNKIEEYKKEVKDILEKNQKLERVNFEINKQFFEQKSFISEKENQLNEELENRNLKISNLSEKLREVSINLEMENVFSNKISEAKIGESLDFYKKMLFEKENLIKILKDQYSQVQKIYLRKIEKLEEMNAKLAEKSRFVEETRIRETEGFQIEIRNLKEKVNDLRQECQEFCKDAENEDIFNQVSSKRKKSVSRDLKKRLASSVKKSNKIVVK